MNRYLIAIVSVRFLFYSLILYSFSLFIFKSIFVLFINRLMNGYQVSKMKLYLQILAVLLLRFKIKKDHHFFIAWKYFYDGGANHILWNVLGNISMCPNGNKK